MSARAEATAVSGVGPEALSRYFRVLGDPTRLRIMEALLERERTVSELIDLLAAPQSRVSNHLACLRWCRLVEAERGGRTVVYRVADERVSRILELAASLAEPNCDHLASCKRIGPDWI
ncbi:MAG: metalloregulator ArsR/SmtB family transcription factor [Actinobacteria bacterium]|nr:metalloregulator ArsR/SmtB family transcription factor [Actinomycetota bacterium]